MAKSSSATAETILELLKEDHQKVKELFKEFEDCEETDEKERLAQTILTELDIHAAIEEELVYPAIRRALSDRKGHEEEMQLMDDALEEHHVVHLLVQELKGMTAEQERFEAKCRVLGELVKHHVKEEEKEMFPQAKKGDLDWEELTSQVLSRREQLMSEIGLSE